MQDELAQETLGTEHLKQVISIGIGLGQSLSEKLEDGKLSLVEKFQLLGDFREGINLVKAAPKALEEFKDLDASERAALVSYFEKEFDLANDRVETIIEKSLNLVSALADLIEAIKAED